MRIRLATDADTGLTTQLRLAFLADHRGIDPTTFPSAFAEATAAFMADRHRAGDLLTWLAEPDGSEDEGNEVEGIVSMLLHRVPPRPSVDDQGGPAPSADQLSLADELGTIEGYVINLFVPPLSRRQGIGGYLLDACVARARSDGYRRLTLHATDDGLPLYARTGFAPNPRWMELPL